jgi:hypothetical protein
MFPIRQFKLPETPGKQTIFFYNYKQFKNLLTPCEKYKCIYVNRYGEKCNNNCLKYSPFKMREIFCEYHIQNYTNFIIKFINVISKFIKIENHVNLLINQYYTSTKLNFEKIKVKNALNELFTFVTENNKLYEKNNYNEEFILISQPVIKKLKLLYFKLISLLIYDTHEYRTKMNMLKLYSYDCIISRNLQNRKDTIKLLKDLSSDTNNCIGKVFKESKFGDINVIDIIGTYF